ncbi:MAG: WD40 repeat domain-containing protein [Colwellia sp.]|nr:WD40 repeat domain-containing protein [Colwellia sp.]
MDKDTKGGYRDIKVNVVYKSQDPMHNGAKMICEIQLLIINYLQEKKRIHKLYSIQREAIYFEEVSKQGMRSKSVKDVKELQFNPILNVKEEVSLNYNVHNPRSYMMKSSVDSDLGLLGIEGIDWFGVVDMKTKKPIFQMPRSSGTISGETHFGLQTHHWIKHNNTRLVSIQTCETEIKMFEVKVEKDVYKFVEAEQYTVKSNTAIDFIEFDGTFDNLLLVTDKKMLEMRSMTNVNAIVHSIPLEEAIVSDTLRNLRLSADGSICGLAGGDDKNYFYLIDIDKGKQHKLTSDVLYGTYVPCFINGRNNLVAVGDSMGMIEIWDVWEKEVVTTLSINAHHYIIALSSTNNVLAVFANDKKLRLYDVRNWECFYTKEYDFLPSSLHLTEDLKYVTLAGKMHQCIVLEIE